MSEEIILKIFRDERIRNFIERELKTLISKVRLRSGLKTRYAIMLIAMVWDKFYVEVYAKKEHAREMVMLVRKAKGLDE